MDDTFYSNITQTNFTKLFIIRQKTEHITQQIGNKARLIGLIFFPAKNIYIHLQIKIVMVEHTHNKINRFMKKNCYEKHKNLELFSHYSYE